MQTHLAGSDRSHCLSDNLNQEADGLEGLHSGLKQQVGAWRLAHEAAVDHASAVLARMDALIARLEAR